MRLEIDVPIEHTGTLPIRFAAPAAVIFLIGNHMNRALPIAHPPFEPITPS